MPEPDSRHNSLERIPFPSSRSAAIQPETDERFSEAELQERLQQFSVRFAEIFRGLNNAEIARRCKTTDSVIKNYVEAKRFPTVDILLQIQRSTTVNLHWLLTGKGQRRIESGDMFTEEEEKTISDLAKLHGRTFSEEVRALALGASELLKKLI